MPSIRVYLRPSAVALLGSLVVGCAELRWSKPGADAARLEEDLGQCRMEARLQAARESVPHLPGAPLVVGADAQGRGGVAQPRARGTDPLVIEQDFTRQCMKSKGYELLPVE